MKEMHQHNKSKLPCKLFVDKKYITLETEKAKKFNEFFTEIGPTLARKTPAPGKPCESFLKKPEMSYDKRIKGYLFLPKDEQEYQC